MRNPLYLIICSNLYSKLLFVVIIIFLLYIELPLILIFGAEKAVKKPVQLRLELLSSFFSSPKRTIC